MKPLQINNRISTPTDTGESHSR